MIVKNAVKIYNSLDGKKVSLNQLQELRNLAIQQSQNLVVDKIDSFLKKNRGPWLFPSSKKEYEIVINEKLKPEQGLGAASKSQKSKRVNKKFISAFGKSYEMKILSKEKIYDIIDNIEEEKILEKLLSKHVTDGYTHVYLNVETGKLEYHHFIGNTDLQQKGHLVELYYVSGNLEEGLDIEDFLDEDEIKEAKKGSEWDIIRNLDDYEERLIDAWKFYFNGFSERDIIEQVGAIYN